MLLQQSALPYSRDALEPYISERTVHFHYDKHHKGYLDKLNHVLADHARMDIWQLMNVPDSDVAYLAAEGWNHAFYWKCIGPNGGGAPRGALAERINRDFGSLSWFKQAFAEAASGELGSGWGWLCVCGDGTLHVFSTPNAENPYQCGVTPLLTIDLWEHAYYLDYQHQREKYVEAYLDHLVQWEFAAEGYRQWRVASESDAHPALLAHDSVPERY